MLRLDEFLEPMHSYNRLLREYEKHGSLTIGFDFDGTVHDYHKTGASHEMVRELLRELKDIGCKLYCWTAYPDLEYVKKFLEDINIVVEGINTDAIPLGWESRKPFFSALLDDRAGLIQVYNELRALINYIKKNRNV
jgi:hypothetical protein